MRGHARPQESAQGPQSRLGSLPFPERSDEEEPQGITRGPRTARREREVLRGDAEVNDLDALGGKAGADVKRPS
jgi:hypothetical protein